MILLITFALDVTIVPLITTFLLEIVLFLWLALTATHLWKMLSTIFLYCPVYAAHCIALFTSAAHILGDKWLLALDKKKIECFLLVGPLDLQFQSNVRLFEQVQSFISHSSRFS